MTTADWLRQKQRDRAKQIKAEWLDEMGHDRAWWLEEAKRRKTDWSSLLRQRLRVMQWVRDGRPPMAQWVKNEGDAEREFREVLLNIARNAQAKLTKRPS
jgi:hypothetical protein